MERDGCDGVDRLFGVFLHGVMFGESIWGIRSVVQRSYLMDCLGESVMSGHDMKRSSENYSKNAGVCLCAKLKCAWSSPTTSLCYSRHSSRHIYIYKYMMNKSIYVRVWCVSNFRLSQVESLYGH